jgi:hypothetical protein
MNEHVAGRRGAGQSLDGRRFVWPAAAKSPIFPSMPMSQAFQPQPVPATPDYIIIVSNEDDHHSSFHDFAEKVNRKLRAGYQLHGPPTSINKILCQAMVRLQGAQASGETTVFYKRPEDLRGRSTH